MVSAAENLELYFFREHPPKLDHEGFASSLQSLESSFLLLSLSRYVDALIANANAIERAIKAALKLPPECKDKVSTLIKKILPELSLKMDSMAIKDFLEARNWFVHYGFVKKDELIAADLMLQVGIPFLECLYKEKLKFDLFDSLDEDRASLLRMALDVFQENKTGNKFSSHICFRIFAHSISWHVWDCNYPEPFNFDEPSVFELAEKLQHKTEPSWRMDCPICGFEKVLVCKLDEDALDNMQISITCLRCVNCDLSLPPGSNLLCDAFLGSAAQKHKNDILKDYGLL